MHVFPLSLLYLQIHIYFHWMKEDLHEESASPFLKLFLFALNFSNQQCEALIQVRRAGFDFFIVLDGYFLDVYKCFCT